MPQVFYLPSTGNHSHGGESLISLLDKEIGDIVVHANLWDAAFPQQTQPTEILANLGKDSGEYTRCLME
jgi:hypothetical protein